VMLLLGDPEGGSKCSTALTPSRRYRGAGPLAPDRLGQRSGLRWSILSETVIL
jgi:hypothetical protein